MRCSFILINTSTRLNNMKKELLDIIACPQCKGPVELRNDEKALLCHTCQLSYAIRDNIPIMIIEEAEPISSEFSETSSAQSA